MAQVEHHVKLGLEDGQCGQLAPVLRQPLERWQWRDSSGRSSVPHMGMHAGDRVRIARQSPHLVRPYSAAKTSPKAPVPINPRSPIASHGTARESDAAALVVAVLIDEAIDEAIDGARAAPIADASASSCSSASDA